MKEFEHVDWICKNCADIHCNGMPKNHIATFHSGICDICDSKTIVTEPRDYGYFKYDKYVSDELDRLSGADTLSDRDLHAIDDHIDDLRGK